ncbi:MAG: TetR/AcrR family transcriptional regulator [Rhodospirillales bacterium]|nr:TetR/AcrR family transcriptional regulator [Rhodospirillales bacterium]
MKQVRTRKSAEARKAEIVDAVIRMAGDIGPDRLTTEKMAQEVGISQAGIFRHFPTKGDIWEAVAQRVGEILQSASPLEEIEKVRPYDQLRQLVIDHLGFIQLTPAIPDILFSRELHSENEKIRAFFAGLMGKRQRNFSRLISAEISTGYFKPTLNSDDGAYLILSLIQGLAMRWSLSARSFDLVTEGERLLDLQLDGFKKQSS